VPVGSELHGTLWFFQSLKRVIRPGGGEKQLGEPAQKTLRLQQFQIRHYMGVSAFLIEIGFNKLGLFYRLDKSEEVCILEKRLGDVD